MKADIKGGGPKPPLVGKHRPDYVATKGQKKIIGEVETVETEDRQHAKEQAASFKKAAAKSPNTTFRSHIAK